MSTLRDKTISGIFWSFLQKVGSRGVAFIVMILLARLLTPKDFGLIGMLMIFIQVSQAIVEGGFNLALIQKEKLEKEDYSSVFYLNIAISLLLYLIVYFVAPFIGEFYQQPILISLVRVLSLVFLFNAFSIVQEAKLSREIRFKDLMLINIPSSLIGGLVSITMAYSGFGVWSIVSFQLVSRAVYAIQIWVQSKWKPSLTFSWVRINDLFSFGSKLMLTSIFTVIYNNVLLVVIGKFFPLKYVGYYQNASTIVNVPSLTLTSVLNTVMFPVLATVQNDNKKLKIGVKRVMQQAFFWICPIYVLSAVMAPIIFDFVFGPQWIAAVPYFRWLCIIGIIQPLKTYNLNIINVKGRSDLFLRLQILWKLATFIAIILLIPYGIYALLIVQSVSYVFAFFIFSYYSGSLIEYRLSEQLKDLAPTLFLSAGVGLLIYLVCKNVIWPNNICQILVGFGLGGGIYFCIAKALKFTAVIDFSNVLQEKIKRNNVK